MKDLNRDIRRMTPPELIIKILLIVPATIFFFYGSIYFVLAELNVQPKLNRFYKNVSLILVGAGTLLLAIYFMV
jgi:hypothetical protein